jgi:HSP20 family molecular chaperone IbpA
VIVELQFNLPGIEKVHLKVLVVSMRLHVAAKKGRHAGKRLIVHILGPQTLIVIFVDIDISD